jgi:hypothetical protein
MDFLICLSQIEERARMFDMVKLFRHATIDANQASLVGVY